MLGIVRYFIYIFSFLLPKIKQVNKQKLWGAETLQLRFQSSPNSKVHILTLLSLSVKKKKKGNEIIFKICNYQQLSKEDNGNIETMSGLSTESYKTSPSKSTGLGTFWPVQAKGQYNHQALTCTRRFFYNVEEDIKDGDFLCFLLKWNT